MSGSALDSLKLSTCKTSDGQVHQTAGCSLWNPEQEVRVGDKAVDDMCMEVEVQRPRKGGMTRAVSWQQDPGETHRGATGMWPERTRILQDGSLSIRCLEGSVIRMKANECTPFPAELYNLPK